MKYNFELSEEEALEQLANELLINHYNVSLANENTETISDNLTPGFQKIFGENLKYHGFSRNILVIGAGASKNVYDFFEVVEGIMEHLCFTELKLGEAFTNTVIWDKFREEASKLLNHSITKAAYNEEDLKRIIRNLNFEENLKLFSTIVTPEELANSLKRSLIGKTITHKTTKSFSNITDYLPSLFYEIVAHLFKHRYIDVIINMNFDEMLDSAIEDEMGESTYYKIVNDSDCLQLSEIVDDRRLRIPIYIKPHGTLRSSSSMKYTTESYLRHPTALNQLLEDIFSGYVSDKLSKNLQYKNIIFAGYSFNDIDIQSIVFSQIIKTVTKNGRSSLDKSKFFIFSRTKGKNTDNFIDSFLRWMGREFDYNEKNVHKKGKVFNYIIETVKKNIFFVSTENTGLKNQYASSLGIIFAELYKKIQSKFNNEPFAVKNLVRHELLAKLFSRDVITKNIDFIFNSPEAFYQRRAIFNCLYSFVKYKGKVPMSEVIRNRAGKYQMLYFNIEKNKNRATISENNSEYSNLISYLEVIFKDLPINIEIENNFIYCKKFHNATQNDNIYQQVMDIVTQELINNSYPIPEISNNNLVLKQILENEVINKGTKEINVVYNDHKHGRFYPFKQENIINTNLDFTWKFFDFAVNKDWHTLCMIDDSGKPIYNLYNYAKDCYLTELKKKGRRFYLLCTNDKSMAKDLKSSNKDVEILIINKMKEILGNNFEKRIIDEDKSRDKMALFLDKSYNPIYGIYFFKPSAKTRINPVCFDINSDSSNRFTQKNLDLLFKIFKDSSPEKWVRTFNI